MPIDLSKPVHAAAAAQDDQEGFFWSALELLNTPNSMIMGAISEGIEGGDPVQAAYDALSGRRMYGGKDVLEAAGVREDSSVSRWGGLALDLVNPLDPLNYVGVGALTKAGKAARAASALGKSVPDALRLAPGLAKQAEAGQRALLSFAGRPVIKDIPLPGKAESVLKGIEVGTEAIGKSKWFGQPVQRMFGGKMGKFSTETGHIKEQATTISDLHRSLERTARIYRTGLSDIGKPLNDLSSAEEGALTDVIDLIKRGDITIEQGMQRFIRPGTARAAQRQAAFEAAQKLGPEVARITGSLEGTGLDAFVQAGTGLPGWEFGHTPRVIARARPGAPGAGPLTSERVNLTGFADNSINRALVQYSTQPISTATLTPEGQKLYAQMGGPEFWNKATDPLSDQYNPELVTQFMQKHRMTTAELNRANLPYSYEPKISRIYANIIDQALENVKHDDLVKSLERSGIAQRWDDAVHGGVDQVGRPQFMKIDQGRWRNNPLAIPTEYADAHKAFEEIISPSPRASALGAAFFKAMPEWVQDIKLMSWWKGAAIFGRGLGYYNRNFWTGVINNKIEGVGIRYYGETFGNFLPNYFKKRLDDTYVTLPGSGVKIRNKHILQEYEARRLHGGGIPDIDIGETTGSALGRARAKTFRPFHKINEQVEVAIRMPLALKSIDDVLTLAQKNGLPVPSVIDDVGEAALNPIVDNAWNYARNRVLEAHFDYEDLSDVEKALRGFWIPFYTWARKNIPRQTMKMLTEPGQYMPYVRAYYQGVESSGLTVEDMPPWLRNNFAIPLRPSPDGRNQFLDLTGFLPFMDVAELARVFAGREPGDPTDMFHRRAGRYIATRFNPFWQEIPEQILQKEFLTGREFGDVPREILGVQVSPSVAQAAGLIPPLTEIDRLNPNLGMGAGALLGGVAGGLKGGIPGALLGGSAGMLAGSQVTPQGRGIATQFGQMLGTFEGEQRPHRNEPVPRARAVRNVFGLKTYGADPDQINLSINARKRMIGRFRSKARRAKRDGFIGEAEHFNRLADELEGTL